MTALPGGECLRPTKETKIDGSLGVPERLCRRIAIEGDAPACVKHRQLVHEANPASHNNCLRSFDQTPDYVAEK
jgi:hypothetical protein